MKEGRNSNFEILRIIAILMITAYHYVVHGVADPSGGGGILLNVCSLWGKAGVNIFCLLTGYMLVCKPQIDYRRLKTVEFQVLFYTLTGLVAGYLTHHSIGFGNIIKSVFPVVFEHYWYVTAYVIVFLLSPYLNKMIRNIEQKDFARLLIICFIVWSVIPFFTAREHSGLYWNQFIWFVVMYLTGAYIRLTNHRYSRRCYINAFWISSLLLVLSVVVIEWLAHYNARFSPYITYFRWSNSPLVVITCFALMRIAAMSKQRSVGWINFVASLVFGIYLFQENVFYRDILWQDLLNNTTPTTQPQLAAHIFLSILAVVVIGGVIDYIRIKIFNILRLSK
jgi:hypothetical protein